MFDGLKRLWRGIVKMFDYTTVKNVIGSDVALSQTMIDAINEWKKMQNGAADWINEDVKSLRIEHGICREFADAVIVEMEANIQNNDRLDKIFQKSLADLNENLQDGLALGSFVLRPLGADRAEYVAADKLIPVSFDDSGKPKGDVKDSENFMKSLKEEYAAHFNEETPGGTGSSGNFRRNRNETPPDFSKMTYSEMAAYMAEHPEAKID